MSLYQYAVATGHNNAVGLALFAVQPACPAGIVYPVHVPAISDIVYADGYAFADVYWAKLKPAQYLAILTLHGFSTTDVSDTSRKVTVALPGPIRTTFSNYNAVAVHKRGQGDAKFEGHVYREVHIRYRRLEALS